MKKNRNYLVSIITENNLLKINVSAQNKKEAIKSVEDILSKCDLFKCLTVKKYNLKCKHLRKQ